MFKKNSEEKWSVKYWVGICFPVDNPSPPDLPQYRVVKLAFISTHEFVPELLWDRKL